MPKRVVIADDEPNIVTSLEFLMRRNGYEVRVARDGDETLRLAEQFAPDLIVLDVMMPRIDGWEMLGRLRSNRATSHVPVIVCTIMAQEELALSLGAAGFLKKPVSRQDFLAALDRQVGQVHGLPDSTSR